MHETLISPNLTAHWVGYVCIALFALAYLVVLLEEYTHLRKSKPVMLAAGLIWGLIAYVGLTEGYSDQLHGVISATLVEYAELLLFLLTAMTYVSALSERNAFLALRGWLVNRNLSYKKLFWITGIIAFFLSPVIDNLTTALVLAAVVMAIGIDKPKFVAIGFVNIVIAANAGGAFSPFGDITTLMVWQKGHVAFQEFFALFIPSLVNYLVPAFFMQFAIPAGRPEPTAETVELKRGALGIVILFGLTLVTAVSFHNFLHLPPYLGMMTGLAYLKFYGYYLKRSRVKSMATNEFRPGDMDAVDVFEYVARSEWDTLLFFYGVIFCVGGLGFLGYLALASETMYGVWGATWANVVVGLASAVIDNIPVMVAVLQMHPEMSHGQWLLVTLTAGVGGSMLSIGSAAGVALMGQGKGKYTFFSHLKWTPVIALGYVLSILVHFWVNKSLF